MDNNIAPAAQGRVPEGLRPRHEDSQITEGFDGYKNRYPQRLKCIEPIIYQSFYHIAKSNKMEEEMKVEVSPEYTKNSKYSSAYEYFFNERGGWKRWPAIAL